MNIAFTGHRPESLPFPMDSEACRRFTDRLRDALRSYIASGCDTFYCGAARGMDIIFGELVLAEKAANRPDLKLICALPFSNQARGWDAHWRTRHDALLRGADEVVQTGDSYWPGCYHARNRYMVDRCDLLIAAYNEFGKGGAHYTVNYARKRGKQIVIINPEETMPG